MQEISYEELEKEHNPRYRIEYQKTGSVIRHHRDCWNPVYCKEFIRGLGSDYHVTIYKL